ncbi:MAG: beta-lactamase family protein [Anaerolineaceae bacterium]|nr:beta-lactamase family protein [Anaerolineaceae bacterium]
MYTCTPEDVGLSASRLARIRPAMQFYLDASLAPGFQIAIARRGKLAFTDCFGWQDCETSLPLRDDAIFRIYSMTKPIATTALMILVEEGRVLLNQPVSRYIPAFKDLKVLASAPAQPGGALALEPLQGEITILDLARHTSGLGYGLFADSPVEDLFRGAGFFDYAKLIGTVPLAEMVERITELPLANQPGARWRYSIAIDVIGRLVEIISGRAFGEFLKERIFDPLGMVDTGFFVPPARLDRFTTMYSPGPAGTILPLDRPDDSPYTNPQATQAGGSGLVSTTTDYLRYAQAMLNGGELDGERILSPHTVARMASSHLPPELLPYIVDGLPSPGMGFGLGFGVVMDGALSGGPLTNGTFHWGGAASTSFFIDPREQLTAVLMTQVLNNLTPFGEVFNELVYQAIIE